MTQLLTDTITRVNVDAWEQTELTNGSVAHIVRADPAGGRTPQALVLEARVMGTPVEALCGYTWVPHKNPKSLPICESCKALYEIRLRHDQNNGELPQA
jgi:hypothetical protein